MIAFFFYGLIKAMLDVMNLEFDYPDKPLFTGVQFRLNEGELVHLKGANGAGKTTLLKLLAGLLFPLNGDILYRGESIYQDVVAYQQGLCYVGHKTGVSPFLTVREHCWFESQSLKSKLSFDELMERGSLRGYEEVACGLLSVGLRRRVSLLRLLMSDASLWLLDEPLVALDSDATSMLMTHLNHHLQRGGMVILTSHQALPMNQGWCQDYEL